MLYIVTWLSSSVPFCIRLIAHIRFLHFLHLPLLFGLPLYYISQAADVMRQANNSRSEYHQCLHELELGELRNIHSTVTPIADFTNMTIQPTTPSPTIAYLPSEPFPEVGIAWNAFVDSRVAEWRIAVAISCVFVACVRLNFILFPSFLISNLKHVPHNLPDSGCDQRPIYTRFRPSRRFP